MFAHVFSLSGKQRLVAAGLSVLSLSAVLAVLAVTLIAFNAHPVFGSGSGGGGCFSTTGPVCTFKNSNAFADFSSVDGCIFTDAFAQPFTSLTSPGRTATQSVFIAISKFDSCAPNGGALIESATNFDPTTGLPVFNGTIQFGPKLSTAAINGSAPMFDDFTRAQVFTSTINVSWQGFGPTSTFMDSSHFRSPGFLMNSHSTGASREAEASGVITDETGTNLATPPTLNASLNDSTGGTVQLSHF